MQLSDHSENQQHQLTSVVHKEYAETATTSQVLKKPCLQVTATHFLDNHNQHWYYQQMMPLAR